LCISENAPVIGSSTEYPLGKCCCDSTDVLVVCLEKLTDFVNNIMMLLSNWNLLQTVLSN